MLTDNQERALPIGEQKEMTFKVMDSHYELDED